MPKPHVTFETLRLIAESASGMRNRPTWFIIKETPEGAGYSWEHTSVEESEDTVVIYCAPVADFVSAVDHATIGVETETVNLMKITVEATFPHEEAGTFEADAVFWSVSAVEKFLVPYYASVYGDKGPAMAKAVMDVLLLGRERAADDPDTEAPFAVAHLPSSEYVGEPEGETSFVPRLATLHRGGHVRRVPVARRAQGR
ncbi:MAG TPA: hypothetical protein VEY93_02840 [Longimicrobium sp.]|nr:hypothetical protein [Longimicrobium sp.]